MIPKFNKPKPTNENQPKEKQTKLHPMYKKHLKSIPTDSSVMKQLDLDKLSRDYVLAHEKLTILSLEYVMEHGCICRGRDILYLERKRTNHEIYF